jgi:hypothetical protein
MTKDQRHDVPEQDPASPGQGDPAPESDESPEDQAAERVTGGGENADPANIPSSLNMDRHASAARTGRAEMQQLAREHTEASPEVSAGDVDADWVSGYFVGDETPAGSSPTPGMSVVEDVGKAMGVEYQDAEELKGAQKIEERDRHRWELDPASSEDYAERTRDEGKK